MAQNQKATYTPFLITLAIFVFLTYLTSFYNYLLFHTIAEIFSILIAFAIFIIAWNSREYLDNNYLLFIGIAYLFVGGIDLVHTLAYKGMFIFTGFDANLPTQLWIAGRYLEAFTLVIAPLMIWRKVQPYREFAIYAIVSLALMYTLFATNIFPVCFIEGVGLTPFKIYSEYIICILLVIAAFLLYRYRDTFDHDIFLLLIASIGVTIVAELAFTFYVSVYGFSNLLGHLCKIVSFALIYKALVESGIRRPFDIIFRNLSASEQKFRSLFDNMNDGMALHSMTYDEKGTPVDYIIKEVNPRYEEILNRPAKEVVNRPATEVYNTPEPPYLDHYAQVLATGKPDHFETYADFVNRYFRIAVYKPGEGEFATIFSDITEQKQNEIALNLAMKKISVLTGITRHDILNEVMVAEGCLSLFEEATPEQQAEYLSMLRQVVDSIQRQVEFTRDYQDLGITAPIWQHPGKIIENLLSVNKGLQDVRVKVELDDLEIFADPMLPKVFANLINNAVIHATGMKNLSFNLEKKDSEMVLYCIDDGSGISPEAKDKIFHQGFGRSHGLGLYLVTEILSLTGITITETSTPGTGARFEIHLPEGTWRSS